MPSPTAAHPATDLPAALQPPIDVTPAQPAEGLPGAPALPRHYVNCVRTRTELTPEDLEPLRRAS